MKRGKDMKDSQIPQQALLAVVLFNKQKNGIWEGNRYLPRNVLAAYGYGSFFFLSLISFSFDAHNTSHTLLLSLCLLLPNSRALSVYQECQHLKYSVPPGGPPRTLTVLSLLVSMIQAGDASATLPVHYLPPLMGGS